MIKKLITITTLLVLLNGCSTLQNLSKSTATKWLEQSFGDYIRSLEGQALLDKIPSLIMTARDKWLPPGHQWDVLAANVIQKYVAANPGNNAEVNKVLEAIATELQK